MTKYENEFIENATVLPSVFEVAAAERAYARQTRQLAASIETWEGENNESEWMHFDADMSEIHADLIENIGHPESSEAYMHIVDEYVSMVDHNTPPSGIYLYLPTQYIEQLNENSETVVSAKMKLKKICKLGSFVEEMLTELNECAETKCNIEKEL